MQAYLKEASKAYYAGNPVISDAEFDRLEELFGNDRVGTPEGEAEHFSRLYSLQKKYTDDEYVTKGYIRTPKLDGAAVSVLYSDGKLKLAATRGDGIRGQIITELMECLVPDSIPHNGVIQVVGEVVALSTIENSRNYAAGSLGLDDVGEFKKRLHNLQFIAYGVSPFLSPFYSADMAHVADWGFITVLNTEVCDNFPTDGMVYRLESNEDFKELGHTHKYPRGAYALKDRSDVATVTTILRNVTWQVGSSGKVTPVGHFDTVIIDDAKISKATLHNAGYIEALELHLEDDILVTRAGGIIPRILGRA